MVETRTGISGCCSEFQCGSDEIRWKIASKADTMMQ